MSAIAGAYLLDGCRVDQDQLKRMNDCLSHRGPDGSGLWNEGPVGLAHQMLWTTPESLHEKLPQEADGQVITADARIDNREELLPELGLREEVSDSEVILEAYRKWGRDCVDRLLGDFVFVIWDPEKEELFCARDHMGVRPFYYYYEPEKVFAFATEIKALFAWGVPRQINEVRIGDYLAKISSENKEMTFYQGILRLPSAHLMIVSPDGLKRESYWELDPKREIRLESDEEYEKTFREIFGEAVRCRLRSAFPVGSLLSGGLDSSSVTCTARHILPKDGSFITISGVFDAIKTCDERPFINAVLAGGGIEAHYVYGDLIGPLTDIEKMLWHQDQPFPAPNLFFRWALCKEARRQGVRVLLDGIDGDNVVSHGFTYMTELAGRGQVILLLNEARGVARSFKKSQKGILWRYALYPFMPASLTWLWSALDGTGDGNKDCIEIANADFADRIGLIDRRRMLLGARSKPARTAREHHWRQVTWGIHQLLLEISNTAAAAFSLEIRSPFFDKRLVEFCLALPADQKMRDGWTRRIMRHALLEILPEKIVYRGGKTDLSPNFLHGLLAFHHDALEDLVLDPMNTISNYINRTALQKAYRRMISEEQSTNDPVDIWIIAVLGLWLSLERTPIE
ncbi:MAG: lasso peptide isopeptide bond-forming cyclase [Methanothrix sp.]|nr:MAG: lasso peptide isopeptide bond-forming cyclase [Methanothrix sp.]